MAKENGNGEDGQKWHREAEVARPCGQGHRTAQTGENGPGRGRWPGRAAAPTQVHQPAQTGADDDGRPRRVKTAPRVGETAQNG